MVLDSIIIVKKAKLSKLLEVRNLSLGQISVYMQFASWCFQRIVKKECSLLCCVTITSSWLSLLYDYEAWNNFCVNVIHCSLLNLRKLCNFKVQSCQSNALVCQSRLVRSPMKRGNLVCSNICVRNVSMQGWLASEQRRPAKRLKKRPSQRNNMWINVKLHLLQISLIIQGVSSQCFGFVLHCFILHFTQLLASKLGYQGMGR